MFVCMSDTYTVQRSTTIDAPPNQVYAQIIDFRQWADWSPWDDMDPSMDKTFSGADAGVGAKYGWSGNRKVGQGNMEITDANQPSSVQIALEFLKPFKASGCRDRQRLARNFSNDLLGEVEVHDDGELLSPGPFARLDERHDGVAIGMETDTRTRTGRWAPQASSRNASPTTKDESHPLRNGGGGHRGLHLWARR